MIAKEVDRLKYFNFLYQYAKPYKKTFIMMSIVSNVISFLTLLYPLVFSLLIDRALIEQDTYMFFGVMLMYISIFSVEQLLHFVEYRLWAFHYHRFLYDLKKDIFAKMMRLRAVDINRLSVGECDVLLNRDSENCYQTVNWFVNDFCMNVIRYVLHFIFLALINLNLALIFFIMIPIMASISQLTKKVIRKYANKTHELDVDYSARSIEFFKNLKELHLLRGESRFSYLLNRLLEKILLFNFKKNMLATSLESIYSIINVIFLMLFFYFSMRFILQDTLTIGLYLAAYTYFGSAIIGLNVVLNAKTDLHWNLVSIDKITDLMHIDDENDGHIENQKEVPMIDNLLIAHLSFSYKPEKLILHDVNIEVRKGQKIALIGASGAGKSTLINMLTRFYEPLTGGIFINNDIDTRQFSIYQWRSKISYLQQDVMIFEGSIKDNLLLAKPDATAHEIEDACIKANIWDYIRALPEKLDTVIDQNRALSGGQKQRLGIARSILKKAEILILDECTSALDYKTEAEVLDAIFNLEGITIMMITHRYHHNHRFDQVALLSEGCIVAYDHHDYLLKEHRLYSEIVNGAIRSDT